MTEITQKRMAMIFNEWVKRYAEDPGAFDDLLDKYGKPFEDYGEGAAVYFATLTAEMDKAGLLPKPAPTPG